MPRTGLPLISHHGMKRVAEHFQQRQIKSFLSLYSSRRRTGDAYNKYDGEK